ncbi:MAG: hypothetical protein ABMB14_19710, partial [Myxococcota bacterium]
MLLSPLWWVPVASATPVDCDTASDKATFDQAIVEAEGAIAALDAIELGQAVDRARAVVRCVETELSSDEIARMYRASGIAKYVADDLVAAVLDFEVARAIAPDAPIDESLGKPLRITYDAVPPPTGQFRTLPPPRDGVLVVDGVHTDQAPVDRAFFLQWLGKDGIVHGTWLVTEGDTPIYPLG